DWCHSYNKKSRNSLEKQTRWIKKYEENGWIVLPEQSSLDVDGVGSIQMCHHPYILDPTYGDDKYENWRPTDDGRWLICGHVHQNWKFKEKMINVGVDVWDFKPVSIDEIKKVILEKNY